MNDKAAQLIERLADKFGTTSEYLWEVLINQAYISATTTLLYLIGAIVFGIVLWKLHFRFMQERKGDKFERSVYDQHEGLIGIPMIIGGIIWLVLAIIVIANIPTIINGYFNPEYWALNRILEAFNSSN